jgi:hypothetical protein
VVAEFGMFGPQQATLTHAKTVDVKPSWQPSSRNWRNTRQENVYPIGTIPDVPGAVYGGDVIYRVFQGLGFGKVGLTLLCHLLKRYPLLLSSHQ